MKRKKPTWKQFLRFEKKIMKRGAKGIAISHYYEDNDIISYLIAKFTVMGVYYFFFDYCQENRKVMHEIWTARKLLINAINSEEKFNKKIEEKIMKKYDIPAYDLIMYNVDDYIEKNHIENNFDKIRKDNRDYDIGLNPALCWKYEKNVPDRELRIKAVELSKKIEDDHHKMMTNKNHSSDKEWDPESNYYQLSEHEEYKDFMKFYTHLAKNMRKWWS